MASYDKKKKTREKFSRAAKVFLLFFFYVALRNTKSIHANVFKGRPLSLTNLITRKIDTVKDMKTYSLSKQPSLTAMRKYSDCFLITRTGCSM